MQLTNKINGLALATIFAGALVSCTNDLNEPVVNKPDALPALKLVKAPDVTAWSGEQILGNTFAVKSTRATGAEVTYETCKTSAIDREAEEAFVNEKLPEKNGNISDDMNTDVVFYAAEETTFEMYPVFSQTTTPNSLGVYYTDADGEYHEVIVWENMDPWSLTETKYDEPVLDSWVEDPNHWSGAGGYYAQYGVTYSKGVSITIPAGCTFGFYWKGHNNTGETVYFSDSSKNEEVNRTDGGGNPIGGIETIHAVTFEHDGKTYLGFEDWTDFDYQDWVFTCDKILKKVGDDTSESGQTPEEGDESGNEGGNNNGGDDQNVNTGGENGDGEETEDPDVETSVINPTHKNDVEINLSIEEKPTGATGVADLVSKLSIHVRYATSVDVFIPMPYDYVIPADDLFIFGNHQDPDLSYGGALLNNENSENLEYSIYYEIGDYTITLHIAYETVKDVDNYTTPGIHIWTSEIPQEVLDYCMEYFQDGINFEIYNYFTDQVDLDELKSYLNQATVAFGSDPDLYVNAFNTECDDEGHKIEDGNVNPNDCSVKPRNESLFEDATQGSYKNGSPYNQLYHKK